jgi:hypothetical protein
MSKIQELGLMLLVVCALGTVLVTAAAAEVTLLAEWLAANGMVFGSLGTTTGGELNLEDESTAVGKVRIRCSITLDGSIVGNGIGSVEKLLTKILGAEIGQLTGEGLLCKAEFVCENNTDTELWPMKLPWPTLLILMEDGSILELIENVSFSVKCLVLGFAFEDECSGSDVEVLTENVGSSVYLVGKFAPNLNCSQGGTGSGKTEVPANEHLILFLNEGISLSAVSE